MALNSSNTFMFLIGIPLYFFHFSVTFLLIWKLIQRFLPFSSAYYRIFLFICIADTAFLFVSLFGIRLPDLGFFQEFYINHGYFAGICLNLISIFSIIQYFGRFFLSFNRFTYFFVLRKYEKIWMTPWYLSVMIAIPLSSCSRHFTTATKFVFDQNGTLSFGFDDPTLLQQIKFQNIVFDSVTLFLSWLMTFLCLIRLSKLNSSQISGFHRHETLLFYHSIVMISVQFAKWLITLCQLYFSDDKRWGKFLTDMLIPVADCFALLGPISLYLINSNFRNVYQHFYHCKLGYEEDPQFRRRYSLSPNTQIHPIKTIS